MHKAAQDWVKPGPFTSMKLAWTQYYSQYEAELDLDSVHAVSMKLACNQCEAELDLDPAYASSMRLSYTWILYMQPVWGWARPGPSTYSQYEASMVRPGPSTCSQYEAGLNLDLVHAVSMRLG